MNIVKNKLALSKAQRTLSVSLAANGENFIAPNIGIQYDGIALIIYSEMLLLVTVNYITY